MAPENGPLEKEIPIVENHQDLGGYLGLRGCKLVDQYVSSILIDSFIRLQFIPPICILTPTRSAYSTKNEASN